MKAIFASKIYKASTRKDKIKAAIADPLNSELIQQLSSYLDDEYTSTAKQDSSSGDEKGDSSKSLKSDFSDTNTGATSSGGLSGHSSSSRLGSIGEIGGLDDSDDSEDNLSDLDDESLGDGDDEDKESKDIDEISDTEHGLLESSTSVKSKKAVTASTDSLNSAVVEIKGMLNLKSETAGVSRVKVKDNEMWLYYKDDVNLNNVMADVVELLEASGYSYLEFNRLARTDNAVVFEISNLDTATELSTDVSQDSN